MPRTLYRDAALADGTGPQLRMGVSLLVDDHRIEWIRPADDEPDRGPDVNVVDASGPGTLKWPRRAPADSSDRPKNSGASPG